jgi:peptidoglycan/xylan/chitin deacetylase (PgdA/CDA1 family)
VEHFAFGSGLGANLGPASPQPDVLNYAWREYGNRVGAWRCLDLFDDLALPTGALINTALYEHCPELVQALVARGDELIGHGHSNAMRQSDLSEADERALLAGCRQRMLERSGAAPAGWLSPWISETLVTPDLLAETGYGYTLNWCHDDQPTRMRTRSGQTLWSIPYPQEVNDIPMVMGRLMDGRAFGELITDHFDEMRRQAARQPLVMGIALHPYIVGQPHRLLQLRKALEHLVRARDAGDVWFTTPGQIYQHMLSIHP